MEPKKKIKRFDGLEIKEYSIPYEPRRQTKLIMEIPTTMGIQEWYVGAEIPIMLPSNHSRENGWVETRTFGREWNPIQIKFHYPIHRATNKMLVEEINEWFGKYNNGHRGGITSNGYKKNVTINRFDQTGVIIESWHLIGSFPSAVHFTDYFEDGEVAVEITLRYDHCVKNI